MSWVRSGHNWPIITTSNLVHVLHVRPPRKRLRCNIQGKRESGSCVFFRTVRSHGRFDISTAAFLVISLKPGENTFIFPHTLTSKQSRVYTSFAFLKIRVIVYQVQKPWGGGGSWGKDGFKHSYHLASFPCH